MNKNSNADLVLESDSCIEVYSGFTGNKHVFLRNTGLLKYSVLLEGSDLDLTISTDRDNSELKIFILTPVLEQKSSKLKVFLDLKHDRCKIDLHIVSLIFSDAANQASATIYMEQGIQESASTLLEETVIISDKVNVRNLPILDIQTNNIAAAHGAKIYRLDPQKIFYLQSKGLSAQQAQSLLISSYPQQLFDGIVLSDEEKSMVIHDFLDFEIGYHA